MKKIVAAAVFMIFAVGAYAHADQPHAAKSVDYSKAEEMPFGIAVDPRKTKRTIRVEMSDTMRFSPAEITVRQGDTVRLVATNKGQVLHEMVLGTMDELKQHAELMKKFPEMEHDEPHMTHVGPGKTGEIGWRFTKPGMYYYACLIPGHFEAGMVGKVIVVANQSAAGQSTAGQSAQQPSPAAPSGALSEGEVRKVDKEAKKITIRHGPLQNLDMPAMTMVFQVTDPAMLEQVKPGDKVKFRAEKVSGAFTVTKIEAAN